MIKYALVAARDEVAVTLGSGRVELDHCAVAARVKIKERVHAHESQYLLTLFLSSTGNVNIRVLHEILFILGYKYKN